jgi:hypothetical protein
MLKIINYKITPEQLAEIETHLHLAGYILNSENIPDWEDLNTACRNIHDAIQDLKGIRERAIQSAMTRELLNNPDLPGIRI